MQIFFQHSISTKISDTLKRAKFLRKTGKAAGDKTPQILRFAIANSLVVGLHVIRKAFASRNGSLVVQMLTFNIYRIIIRRCWITSNISVTGSLNIPKHTFREYDKRHNRRKIMFSPVRRGFGSTNFELIPHTQNDITACFFRFLYCYN